MGYSLLKLSRRNHAQLLAQAGPHVQGSWAKKCPDTMPSRIGLFRACCKLICRKQQARNTLWPLTRTLTPFCSVMSCSLTFSWNRVLTCLLRTFLSRNSRTGSEVASSPAPGPEVLGPAIRHNIQLNQLKVISSCWAEDTSCKHPRWVALTTSSATGLRC